MQRRAFNQGHRSAHSPQYRSGLQPSPQCTRQSPKFQPQVTSLRTFPTRCRRRCNEASGEEKYLPPFPSWSFFLQRRWWLSLSSCGRCQVMRSREARRFDPPFRTGIFADPSADLRRAEPLELALLLRLAEKRGLSPPPGRIAGSIVQLFEWFDLEVEAVGVTPKQKALRDAAFGLNTLKPPHLVALLSSLMTHPLVLPPCWSTATHSRLLFS